MKIKTLFRASALVCSLALGAFAQTRAALTVGPITVQPGAKASGMIQVPAGKDEATTIPVSVIHGGRPGPTLALIAGNHGYEYTPIVAGVPSLFTGGAAFPGNNWILSPRGEEYLSRIPVENHQALRRLRNGHLRFTREALRELANEDDGHPRDRQGARQKMSQLRCPQ